MAVKGLNIYFYKSLKRRAESTKQDGFGECLTETRVNKQAKCDRIGGGGGGGGGGGVGGGVSHTQHQSSGWWWGWWGWGCWRWGITHTTSIVRESLAHKICFYPQNNKNKTTALDRQRSHQHPANSFPP